MSKLEKFAKLGLSEDTLRALEKKGFEEPTPIQIATIPALLKGKKDLVGQAQTGTGKTAAFGLPILEKLDLNAKHIQALILTPTRELAIQVAEEINSYRGSKKIQVVPIYGGQSIDEQLRRLRQGVSIVVGTPGRLMDHLRRKSLNLRNISFLILDEADEMLNMGFIDDVEEILKNTNKEKQVLLFSATMPKEIVRIANKYMGEYDSIAVQKDQPTVSQTDQIYFEVAGSDKFEALCRIIDVEKNFYGLVFCRTKIDVDKVSAKLIDRGYSTDALHGDISQPQRTKILAKFKKKQINILIATDVAARGIDVSDLTHVINFALPQDPEAYIHRIGRTGRAGKDGTAITFITPEEYRKLMFIKRVAKSEIRKAKLPGVKEVIKIKRERIKSEIQEIVQSDTGAEYIDIAYDLLKTEKPEIVVAALLKSAYHDELDERSYSEIRNIPTDKRNISVDTKGKSRLFVAKGKLDKMTPGKLVSFIEKETGVRGSNIKDVQIFDKFSFINVSFQDAELILEVFKKTKKQRRPMVERAQERKRRK